jgi:hypothetical protein
MKLNGLSEAVQSHAQAGQHPLAAELLAEYRRSTIFDGRLSSAQSHPRQPWAERSCHSRGNQFSRSRNLSPLIRRIAHQAS